MTGPTTALDPLAVPANARTFVDLDRSMVGARRVVEHTVLVRFGVTWCGYLLLSAAVQRDRTDYRQLANSSGVAASSVPHLVDSLRRIRLLTRISESPKDGGRVLVTVTDSGRRQLKAIHALVDPLADTLLTGLGELLGVVPTLPVDRQPSDVDTSLGEVSRMAPWQVERMRDMMPPVVCGSARGPGS